MSESVTWLGPVMGAAVVAVAAVSTKWFELKAGRLAARETRLHESRLDVMRDVYARLVRFHRCLVSALDITLAPDEIISRIDRARRFGNQFNRKFQESRIFFDLETCQLFEELWPAAKEAMFHLHRAERPEPPHFGPALIERKGKWRSQAEDAIGRTIPAMKAKIESQFRELLGIDNVAAKPRESAGART